MSDKPIKLKKGVYVCEIDEYGKTRQIVMDVKETSATISFRILKNTAKYLTGGFENMFKEGIARIPKRRSKHSMLKWSETSFTLYPFRSGVPYLFRHLDEINNEALLKSRVCASDSVSKKTAKEIFDLIKDYPTPTLDDDNSIYYTAFNHALECIKIAINNNYDLGENEE